MLTNKTIPYLIVFAGACLLCAYGSRKPMEASLSAEGLPDYSVPDNSPQVENVSIQRLDRPTRKGNVLLKVRFAGDQRPPMRLSIRVDGQLVTLRDDGLEGDEDAGDGVFSTITLMDFERFQESLRPRRKMS